MGKLRQGTPQPCVPLPSGMWKTTSGMKTEVVLPAGSVRRGGRVCVGGHTQNLEPFVELCVTPHVLCNEVLDPPTPTPPARQTRGFLV